VTKPDALEPYAVSICFTARAGVRSSADLVGDLLEGIARGCEVAGCSLIGHIKCHARAGEVSFSCSLTSRRLGPRFRGATRKQLGPGETLDVDLAVLVYGLPHLAIETIVMDSLAVTALEASVDLSTTSPCASPDHDHQPPA
jgi:hypothetical protein